MSGPCNTLGADGRLYLQHGPIELIIEVFGDRDEVGQVQAQQSGPAIRPSNQPQ